MMAIDKSIILLSDRIKQFLYRNIKSPQKNIFISIIHLILWIPAILYNFTMRIRSLLYQMEFYQSYEINCPVISVGNITSGGTGKTPLVKLLAQKLQKKGFKTAILSRGYKRPMEEKRKSKRSNNMIIPNGLFYQSEIILVSDFSKIYSNWHFSGDEPYLLAKSLPGVAVIVGSDRKKTAEYALNQLGANIIILDDGFSHLRIKRNLDILLLDTLNPFGGGYCLPRGLLREPLIAIRRADCIILTRSETDKDYSKLYSEIKKYNYGKPIFKSSSVILRLRNIQTGEPISISGLSGIQILAISGIGNPESFERNLNSLKLDIRQHLIYPDHYVYSREDIDIIRETMQEKHIDWLVTTEKDAVKISEFMNARDRDWYILEIEFQLEWENEFWNLLEKHI